MIQNDLLAAESLDIQFKYPEDYKKFIKNISRLENTPWWMIGTVKDMFQMSYDMINVDHKSSKLLVPFAKSDQSNILACFDLSGRVWLTSCETNDITDTDWGSRFFLPSFTSWLEEVVNNNIL